MPAQTVLPAPPRATAFRRTLTPLAWCAGILFEGKTELSHGPQVLCLAPRVKEILGDYIDHFRPLATKDPESPLLVTHTGSKLNSGTPGEALRAWCAASLGPAVCLTPTDVFKVRE